MKYLPVGLESFSNIIQDGYYYIDKTNLIKDLLNSRSKVTLFTRLRRFGKSLNMYMLKSFFMTGTEGLKFLVNVLYQHYGREVIVLVGGYDVPLDRTYQVRLPGVV